VLACVNWSLATVKNGCGLLSQIPQRVRLVVYSQMALNLGSLKMLVQQRLWLVPHFVARLFGRVDRNVQVRLTSHW